MSAAIASPQHARVPHVAAEEKLRGAFGTSQGLARTSTSQPLRGSVSPKRDLNPGTGGAAICKCPAGLSQPLYQRGRATRPPG
jgi:hypothetical protein